MKFMSCVTNSVVSKEKDEEGKERLVSSKVLVTVGDEEEDLFSQCHTPGAKLQLLKTNLRAKMAMQRAETTKRRQQQKNFMETEEMPAGKVTCNIC